jgi:hypothetical protein
MQKAIQLFEQDFARWDLHIPAADVAARASGMLRQAGWHVFYDFGQDARGEFLDYYAALRDGTDAAVTDDWHVRLYDTGDRVALPTVLEAYMYSRDPRPDELARARRKFADPPAPTAPAAAATPQPVSPQLASPPLASPRPANTRPAPIAPPSSVTKATPPAPATSARISLEVGLDVALVGVEPAPGGDSFASWLLTPALGSPPIVPASAAPEPRIAAAAKRPTPRVAAAPVEDGIEDRIDDRIEDRVDATVEVEIAPVILDIAAVEPPEVLPEVMPDIVPDVVADVVPDAMPDLVPEVLAEIEPAEMEPAEIEPAEITLADAAFDLALDMPSAEADAPAADDDTATSLVFVAEPPTDRVSDRTAAITLDEDALAISVSDYEAQHDDEPGAPTEIAGDEIAGGGIADEDVLGSIPPADERHSRPAPAMHTTDIAAVAGSFEPWWYRPATRRIAMVAAAVIAIIIAGSVVTHHSADASSGAHADAAPPATHAAVSSPVSPEPGAPADQSDASASGDSTAQSADTTPDSLPVASAPSSVSPESGNPAAEDGMARPAGPQSVPPIQQSGTPRAPHGSGRTTDKTGFAQH